MANANANSNAIHNNTKHQKLPADKKQQDPCKFYHHFLYKAAVVAIFLVILPLFPSQAPEFINQSLLTRSWELLHLLLVGIAISYGLFSRRNDETDKENVSKFDNAQTLVSRFLQVSPFFEDEAENSSSDQSSDETTKVETWNNQHFRNEPLLVVAPHEDQGGGGASASASASARSRIGDEKPLLLPVRSLKSRLSNDHDDDYVQYVNESSTISSFSLNRSNSKTGSKRVSSNSSKARNGELEGLGDAKVVLPSPIPWRSRSGRFEPKQEVVDTPKQHASKPSIEESEFNKMDPLVKSQTSRSSHTNPLSSSPSFSSESLAKNSENLIRKKGFYNKSCPPPPPPPPPMFQKSISMKPRYGSFNEGASSFDKELKRSFSSDTNGMNRKRIESGVEVKPRGYAENMSMATKSVRTVRAVQNQALFSRGREIGEEEMMEEEQLVDEEHLMEEPTRKGVGYEHMSFRTDKFMGHSSVPHVSQEEKESFLDKVIVESDDEDTETEDEDVGGRIIEKGSEDSPQQNIGESSKTDAASGSIGDEGPDVDKKADEFIAKFREQIRLQRIESIKRSTRSTRNSAR